MTGHLPPARPAPAGRAAPGHHPTGGPTRSESTGGPTRTGPTGGLDLTDPADLTGPPGSDGTAGPDDLTAGIGLRRIDHVGVAVADLSDAIAHYQRVFGMRCVHTETNEEQGVREAMLAVGPDPDGGYVQLLAPTGPESPVARFLERRGPGLQQVAFTVDDLELASSRLRERGVRLLYDQPRTGTAGSRINFVHPRDAGGVLVELVEPADGHGSRSDRGGPAD